MREGTVVYTVGNALPALCAITSVCKDEVSQNKFFTARMGREALGIFSHTKSMASCERKICSSTYKRYANVQTHGE